MCLWSLGVCCAFAIPAARRYFGMVSDGFQAQERGSWVPGKERAERVLANATSIDGRKEWTCKFCSESNVWTRWRCRRCYSNISAEKHRQAVAAKSGEWSAGSSTSSGEEDRKARSLEADNKELRARIDALEKEGVQGGPSIPSKGGGDSEYFWGESMEFEDEAESRRKLDDAGEYGRKRVEAGARRGSGSAGDHYRVGCGGRHFRDRRSRRESTRESGSGLKELTEGNEKGRKEFKVRIVKCFSLEYRKEVHENRQRHL